MPAERTTLLMASDVSFSYAADAVLRGVSIGLNGGEVLSLVGPNGTGKSTLLRCLLGQLPARGEVRWSDRPLRDWPRRELAKFVAYLPQTPTFEPGLRVREAISMGRTPHLGWLGVESVRDADVVANAADKLGLRS